MLRLWDLFNAPALGSYWETLHSNSLSYLGSALFPNKRVQGLRLDWIKGYDSLPVQLNLSAFDAKPTLRDRRGIETVSTSMPFFREGMRIGEQERQQILTLINGSPAYLTSILNRVFDDHAELISGAILVPEIMRMSLLQTGTISMASSDTSGQDVSYSYNFDPNGTWKSENHVAVAKAWSDPDSKPIQDILSIARLARAKGHTISRMICSPATWGNLLVNSSLGKDVFPLGIDAALSDVDLQSYIQRKTGITMVVYEKMYKNTVGREVAFMGDDVVVCLPSTPVGSTYYGTTPEEADIMGGQIADAEVRIVDGGIAVVSKKEYGPPVNVSTIVSAVTLPSFELMNQVYVLKVQ